MVAEIYFVHDAMILSRKLNEIISNHGNHMVSRELVTEIYFVHDAILRGMQTVP